jgi:hypothetical protein
VPPAWTTRSIFVFLNHKVTGKLTHPARHRYIMPWLEETLESLARQPVVGYAASGAPASEPTAIACLALARHDRQAHAKQAAEHLAGVQAIDGSVGVRPGEATPGWPTSLAVVAWRAVGGFETDVERGCEWLLKTRGETVEQSPEYGHNTQLVGWSWAEGTHSWIEPTALAVLGLKAADKGGHERTRDAVRLLLDRQLPGGGCNYGNTMVLGQMLKAHVQPSGLALLALAGEQGGDLSGPHAPREEAHHAERDGYQGNRHAERDGYQKNRVAKSLAWLRRSIGAETTATSLAWALLGLKAHGVSPPQADEWLAFAAERVMIHDRSPHKLALLALAAKGWPA